VTARRLSHSAITDMENRHEIFSDFNFLRKSLQSLHFVKKAPTPKSGFVVGTSVFFPIASMLNVYSFFACLSFIRFCAFSRSLVVPKPSFTSALQVQVPSALNVSTTHSAWWRVIPYNHCHILRLTITGAIDFQSPIAR